VFRKILIANRGEIACRIARTCRRLGIQVATVHSEADREAQHVREIGESVLIGKASATSSYLRIDRIIDAARQVGADAVHPGYGFLAENAEFALALEAAGIAFVGPSADVLSRFGDKAAAKAEAMAAGVPVIAGTTEPAASVPELVAAVEGMRLPVLLKAAAGGGGKGMRVVSSLETLVADIEAATREGQSSFGNPNLIVEQYLPEARHIEVQVLGDGQGGVIHLFDRECSLQRRHQKVIEEAPVTSLPEALRQSILDHAVRLCEAVRYRGLGTVEFIARGNEAYFLEVNPRIQVEHPVTEEITGLDLVELQIRAVAEGRLPLSQTDVTSRGVAVEARLYAEDPETDFLPSTGRIDQLRLPSGIRVDSGIMPGMVVTQFYDPMIAKLISRGSSRREAYDRLAAALGETAVAGVRTNLSLLRTLCADANVLANNVHTGSIAPIVAKLAATPAAGSVDVAIGAALWLREQRAGKSGAWSGWNGLAGWRLGAVDEDGEFAPVLRLVAGAASHLVSFGAVTPDDCVPVFVDGRRHEVRINLPNGQASFLVEVDGRSLVLDVSCETSKIAFVCGTRDVVLKVEPYLSGVILSGASSGDAEVKAPMMGQIVAVDVRPGQRVVAGDRLVLMESMKMELVLRAQTTGTVASVHCAAGDMIERDQPVVIIAAEEAAA